MNILSFLYYVAFEVFTAVVMKSIIFWDVTPCRLLSCNRRFGGTYRLNLQGRRNNSSKNQQVSRWQTSVATQQTTRRHIPEDDTLHFFINLQSACFLCKGEIIQDRSQSVKSVKILNITIYAGLWKDWAHEPAVILYTFWWRPLGSL
jgi:hypothetical protein